MGMFDSVFARCPKCGAQLEFQSKAGECTLAEYSPNSVPVEIAKDISGESQECKCGAQVSVVTVMNIDTVPMMVIVVANSFGSTI